MLQPTLLVAVLMTLSAGVAFSAARYRIVDLGAFSVTPPLPGFSEAYAINNFGQIVGSSTIGAGFLGFAQEAFLYDSGVYPNRTMTGLGIFPGVQSSYAFDINNLGQIVGRLDGAFADHAPGRAFVFNNGRINTVAALDGSYSSAYGINDYGQIVGDASGIPFQYDLVEANIVPLPALLNELYDNVYAINNVWQIVGSSRIFYPDQTRCTYAVFYDPLGLPVLISIAQCPDSSVAQAVNNLGHVVVNEAASFGSSEVAFLWGDGNVTQLGTLGGPYTYAYGINTNDQIVGKSSTDPEGHVFRAFLWEKHQATPMQELNSLVTPGSGWDLQTARDINEHGQIVGYGFGPNGGHAFLLNPILKGVDVSEYSGRPTQKQFERLRDDHSIRFVIAAGWQGLSRNTKAWDQVDAARNAGLLTAGYCFLSFALSIDGACQVREALAAFRDEGQYLGFLAIDVESSPRVPLPAGLAMNPPDAQSQALAVKRIWEAVDQVEAVGLRPIIYTANLYWQRITGNTDEFSRRGIPLWHAQDDDLEDLDNQGCSPLRCAQGCASFPFGGWQQRAGKQYRVDSPNCPVTLLGFSVDMNVFDLGAFSFRNPNYKAVPTCPLVDLAFSAPNIIIHWDDTIEILESSPGVDGPWTAVEGAASPYTVAPLEPQKFYRVRRLPPAPRETWTTTSAMLTPRRNHRAALLPTGKLLIAGGDDVANSAELFNPNTGAWTNTSTMVTNHFYGTATLLPNGKVLVAGGAGDGDNPALNIAELFEPATESWTQTGSMITNREFHTATLLPNGKVLVAGGDDGNNRLSSAELYDPATETWSATGSLTNARGGHTATLLPNGKVLVTGGDTDGSGPQTSAEIYDFATQTWALTGQLTTQRTRHKAVLLPNGRVLVVGGNVYGSSSAELMRSAELYDPASRTWTNTTQMTTNRIDFTTTLLPSGRVLVAGGYDLSYNCLSSAELYDPATKRWSGTGPLTSARSQHTATLLPSGKVIVVGGAGVGIGALSSAELY